MRDDWDEVMADLSDRFEAILPPEHRTAKYERSQKWQASDGWIIGYTTTRVIDSKHDGKFLVFAYQPYGKGARTNPTQWKLSYERSYSKRNAARHRALELFGKHDPAWQARRDAHKDHLEGK